MIESIVFCLVAVSAIAALFFAWYFYQAARDKERMFLTEQGEKYDEILRAQKENRFKLIFPPKDTILKTIIVLNSKF